MLKDLLGVVATIRRHLEMVETNTDRLEVIRLITYFSNKTIFHLTKDDQVWDQRMVDHNQRVMRVGVSTPETQIHKLYFDSVELYLDVKHFLDRLAR